MKTKKILALAAAALLIVITAAGCGSAETTSSSAAAKITGNVKTGGSTSVEKVMGGLIQRFEADNAGATVDYEMNGSGDGIKNTISGLYEIGHSSRELKKDGSESGLEAIPYAIDGIVVVLNKANTLTGLTTDQIKGIYTGEITNWKVLGGKDAPITVITREDGSGTRSAFMEIIGFKEMVKSATVQSSTGAIQTEVEGNPNAIGYLTFSDVDEKRVIPATYNGIKISNATLKDGTYALKREFYLLKKTDGNLSAAGQAFIDFVLSESGQAIVADNKLLSIK